MRTWKLLLVGTSLVALTVSTQAQVVSGNTTIVDEEFLVPPYVGVSNPSTLSSSSAWLAGQSATGTGLTGNWVTGGNQIVMDSDTTLSVTGRASAVGSVQSTYTSELTSTASLNTNVQSAIASADQLWMSFLISGTSAGGTQRIELHTSSSFMSIGQRLDGYQAVVAGNGVNNNTGGFDGFSANQTYLIIGQLLIDRAAGQNETLNLWVTQDQTTFNPLSTPLLTTSGNLLDGAGSTFTSLTIYKNTAGFTFDSLQVEIIPEPSTVALVALSGLLLLGLKFRRPNYGC